MAERKNGSIPVNEKTLEEMKNIAKSLKIPEQFII
jgi:hypothetical protein